VGAIGTVPKPASRRQAHSVDLFREECEVGDGIKFVAILARPSVVPNATALEALCSGDKEGAENLAVWLASLALEKKKEAGGSLGVRMGGKDYSLVPGEHFQWSNI